MPAGVGRGAGRLQSMPAGMGRGARPDVGGEPARKHAGGVGCGADVGGELARKLAGGESPGQRWENEPLRNAYHIHMFRLPFKALNICVSRHLYITPRLLFRSAEDPPRCDKVW